MHKSGMLLDDYSYYCQCYYNSTTSRRYDIRDMRYGHKDGISDWYLLQRDEQRHERSRKNPASSNNLRTHNPYGAGTGVYIVSTMSSLFDP